MCSKDLIEDRQTLSQLTCVPLPYKYLYSTMYSTAGHNVFQDNAKISISEFMVIFFIDVQIFVAFGGHV